MTLIRIYILLLACLLSPQLGAVHLEGKIANASGKELQMYYVSNFMTNEVVVVDSCMVSDSGEYVFDFESAVQQVYYVNVGLNNAQIALSPDQQMTIDLPDYLDLTRKELLNPFFDADNVLLYKEELKDANYYITEIEIKSTLLLDKTLKSGNPTYQAEKALAELRAYGDKLTDPLAKNYLYYSEALFAQLANPENGAVAKQKYLRNSAPQIGNPAFVALFQSEYDNAFLAPDGLFYDFVSEAIIEGDVSSEFLDKLSARLRIKDRTMAELVAVKGFYDAAVYAPTYERLIAELMGELEASIVDEEVKYLCASTRNNLQRLMVGAPAPYYELCTLNNKKVPLVLRRKYVLLAFVNTTIHECQVHLRALEEIKATYKRHLEVVCVATHQTPDELQRFLDRNEYKNLYFTIGEDDDLLLDDYDVKVLPTYFLIGNDGNLLASPLSPPDEDMSAELVGIMGY